MYDTKLLKLLSALSNKDRNKLRLFLTSPYFSTNNNLIKLYDVITELFFVLGNKTVDKEYVWSLLYPDHAFRDSKMRLLLSDLFKKCEDYLSVNAFLSNRSAKERYLLNALNNRYLDAQFGSVIRSIRKSRSGLKINDAEFWLEEHMITRAHNDWVTRQTNVRSKKVELDTEDKALDYYYISSKLRNSCTLLNSASVLNLKVSSLLLEEVIAHIEESDYDDIPSISVYYNIYRMMTAENPDAYYNHLKTLVDQHYASFEKKELWDVYAYAINYCIRKSNSGHPEFLQELFEWYKSALAKRLMFENRNLEHWDFKNMVAVGLAVGKFDWVRSFIEEYKVHIAAPQRQNAYSYNLSKYYFARSEYDKVLELLRTVEYDDVFYNLDSKTMLLKVYFERQDISALQSLIDSFSLYLRRNKIVSGYHRTNYLNLLRFTKKLLSIPPASKDRLRALETSVRDTRQIVDINWLLGQIEQKLKLR